MSHCTISLGRTLESFSNLLSLLFGSGVLPRRLKVILFQVRKRDGSLHYVYTLSRFDEYNQITIRRSGMAPGKVADHMGLVEAAIILPDVLELIINLR